MYKKCSKCNEVKSLDVNNFYKDKNSKSGFYSCCKECKNNYMKEKNIKPPEYVFKKQCAKCEKLKDSTEFYKNKSKSDGLQLWCKECRSKYNKNWKNENREYIRKRDSLYAQENKDKINEYHNKPIHKTKNSKIYKEIIKYEETVVDKNGLVKFKCSYCGDWYYAGKRNVSSRLYAIEGKVGLGPERRLYCSKNCKDECPIYRQKTHPKDFKPATSREAQPQLRQLVLKRDNYTCQKCGKHKDELDCGIHCHHIWPLNESPITSADIDECITLCKDCHKEVHMNTAGCGYSEMKCSH